MQRVRYASATSPDWAGRASIEAQFHVLDGGKQYDLYQDFAFGEATGVLERMAPVLGDRLTESVHSQFKSKLGDVLWRRDLARAAYAAIFGRSREAYFLDTENRNVDLSDLNQTIKAFQREAAAFSALIAEIRSRSADLRRLRSWVARSKASHIVGPISSWE